MSLRDAVADLKCDIDRYRVRKSRSRFLTFLIEPCVQATVVYRFGHWLDTTPPKLRLLRYGLQFFFFFARRFTEITTGIYMTSNTKIGPGLLMPHFGGIVVGPDIVIGRNCNILHGVTIGRAGREEKRGSPQIGDRVYIAPGAKVLGKITIGNDVAIGANAVVVKSVPDRAVVGGNPAKIISYRGSFEFIQYFNMETDPEREQSLVLRDQPNPENEVLLE